MERELDRPLPLWPAAVLAVAAVVLVPWAVVLNLMLPSREVAAHWDIAWTGFDVVLAASLLATAYVAVRRRDLLQRVAPVSGTLLLCDAWFDVLTASSRTDITVAVLLAGFGELPLAFLCFLLASGLPLRSKARVGFRRFRLP